MPSAQSLQEYFAVCAPGLEPLLDAELRALRMAGVERQVGGVFFRGRMEDAWRANLELRTAVRVLWRLSRFQARDADELYKGVSELDWSRFLAPDSSLWIDARTRESELDHSLFIEQRAKDAIVDQLREQSGERPSVERDEPDLRVHIHLFRDRATLSIDTSGASLHLRGWRCFQGRAPLAETLAAAIVQFSGWDRRSPLIDPFCGSGTLLVEAAHLALDRAPGLSRERFGFERLPGFERKRWDELRAAARARVKPLRKLVLRGSELDGAFIEGARENLAAAEVEELVQLEQADAGEFDARRGWNAWVVTNPPYGERVGDGRVLFELYEALGARLLERGAGFHLTLLSGARDLADAIELSFPLSVRAQGATGGIACEVLCGDVPD